MRRNQTYVMVYRVYTAQEQEQAEKHGAGEGGGGVVVAVGGVAGMKTEVYICYRRI